MKNQFEVIVIVLVFALLGVRLYQKYVKKNTVKPGKDVKPGSSFSTSSKDDDYEPYSKK